MTISVVLMMSFYLLMKQFSIKMLQKKKKHWKYVRILESILVLWLRSQTR